MRLFVALDLEESIRQKIVVYLGGIESFAPEVRWAKAEALHVTLKFIGEQPEEQLAKIQAALAVIQLTAIPLTLRGYGFFPAVTSARVFWLGIESGPELGNLANCVDIALAPLGIPQEQHAFTPHLTLARGGSGSPRRIAKDKPSSRFPHLQQRLSSMPLPDFGTMTAREFFLYESKLSPVGSRYTKLASFPLR